MANKKVLHLSMTRSIGGIASFQRNLFENINKDRVTFEFVTTYGDSALIPYFREKGVRVHKLPPQKTVIPYCIALFRLLKKGNYDAVHIHKNSCANPMAFIVAYIAGVKLIIAHSHNTASVGGKAADFFHVLFRPLVRRLSDVKLACSDTAAAWLYGEKYAEKHKIEIIKNGIDTKLFSYNENTRNEVRSEFKWENKYVIGHVGNYIPQKNHYFMVDIAAEAVKFEKNIVLIFLGRGDAMEKVREYAVKKGVADHIVFMGARTDINRFYQAMDMFLFPSLHEGLPIAGVEAQTADLPCLFSDAVTKEIILTERTVTMSLEEGAQLWAKKAVELAKSGGRRDVSEIIRASGYDAADTGRRMEQIYCSK